MPNPDDPEIRAFVIGSPLPTYSDIATEVACRFGERAWTIDMIRAAKAALPRSRRSRFRRDPAVMAYITDHADLIQLDRIVEGGRVKFGHHRFPSRSQLHRLIAEMRVQAATPLPGPKGRPRPKTALSPLLGPLKCATKAAGLCETRGSAEGCMGAPQTG